MNKGTEYVRLFQKLPVRVRQGFEKGRWRVSYSALRRFNMMTAREKKKVCAEIKKCRSMDEAIANIERISGAQKIAKRQRDIGRAGKIPEFLFNSTPMASSPDLEAFFIPPGRPERELYSYNEITLTKPVGRKLKVFGRRSK